MHQHPPVAQHRRKREHLTHNDAGHRHGKVFHLYRWDVRKPHQLKRLRVTTLHQGAQGVPDKCIGRWGRGSKPPAGGIQHHILVVAAHIIEVIRDRPAHILTFIPVQRIQHG